MSRKWTTGDKVAPVVGIASILALILFSVPFHETVCQTNPYTEHEKCATHQVTTAFLIEIGMFADEHAGGVTAAATVFLAFITFGLVMLGRDQSSTSKRQLRAYVFLEQANLSDGPTWPNAPNPVLTGCPNTFLVIKNFGSTPAFNVRHWSAVKVSHVTADGAVDAGILDAPADLTGILSPMGIPPTGVTSLHRNLGRGLTNYEMGALLYPNFGIIVYGRITYEDVFGDPHETNYCLGYSGTYPPPPGVILVGMKDGNSAT